MLTILDYGAGNQTSVLRALRHLGIDAAITDSPDRLSASEGIIFPGVGSAGQAMDVLTSKGLDSVLARAVREKQPVLGICLGCQILLDRSEEHDTKTLGLVHGETLAFPAGLTQEDGSPAPVPHMGWNSLNVKKPDDPLFRGIPAEARFYFVHSYYVKPDPSLVLATTDYGMEFCSAYGGNGLWAVQFHPEKSGRFGLAILRNFYDYCKGTRDAR
ncbi:MAG: imidazole glycerol phosphate synthase subunit HisH [Desulfovibrio sp.]|nr:imidazole glycerol phosphate synthase subunit HisH [Desulfovibrio sp.]